MVMTPVPDRAQVLKILASLFCLLVFSLCGDQAAGAETHFIDEFIKSQSREGRNSFIKFGAVRINLQPGPIADDDRVEPNPDFNSNFDLRQLSDYFETQAVIDFYYEVTQFNAGAGAGATGATASVERNAPLAMLSVISRLFMGNRATAPNRGGQTYAEAEFERLIRRNESQADVFTMAFYGFRLRQNNHADWTTDERINLTVALGGLIQRGINQRAHQQNRRFNFNAHFGRLHDAQAIAESFQEQNVATTFALAVGLNALLEAPSQLGDESIEHILRESPILPLAQQTLIVSLDGPSTSEASRRSLPSASMQFDDANALLPNHHEPARPLNMESLLSPDDFPLTLANIYRHYRQSKGAIPSSRIPFILFLAIGASTTQDSTSLRALNRRVASSLLGIDLSGAAGGSNSTPVSVPVQEAALTTIEDNLLAYFIPLRSDTVFNDKISDIIVAIMYDLRRVNKLEPNTFTQSKQGKAYKNLAKVIVNMFTNRDQLPTEETRRLRELFREYFGSFAAALQQLVRGDRESPEARALIALLRVLIEVHTTEHAPASPADRLNKRQPPFGGAGASFAAP